MGAAYLSFPMPCSKNPHTTLTTGTLPAGPREVHAARRQGGEHHVDSRGSHSSYS